jgi:fucose 4-O-acetylase-like acetyltransferase
MTPSPLQAMHAVVSSLQQKTMTSAGPDRVQVPVDGGGTVRLAGLDFTKGVLVLLMVLYHWSNYFLGVEGFYYRYIRFLTPSFIFITGFLVGHVYLPKYTRTDMRLPKRLLIRGAKLAAIFAMLNAAPVLFTMRLSSSRLLDWPLYLGQASASGRAAFTILLPIAYLLMIAAALALLSRVYQLAFRVAAIAGVVAAGALEATGRTNAFVELISIGLLGIIVGEIPMQRIESGIRRLPLVTGIYVAYLYSITIWKEVYALQLVGVAVTLAIIYLIGCAVKNRFAEYAVLMGKYSLLGYIAQIAILQTLHTMLRSVSANVGEAVLSLGLGIVLTCGIVTSVDWLRGRVPLLNRSYAAVFL